MRKRYLQMENDHIDLTRLYHILFENPYIGILISDGMGKVLMVNEAQTRITGIPMERFIGKNMHDVLKQNILTPSSTVEVLRVKEPVYLHQIVPESGRNYEVKGVPVFDETGEILYVVSYLLDISDMMQMKKLNSRLREDMRKIEDKYQRLLTELDVTGSIVFHSKTMNALMEKVSRCANSDASVLITGASGTGKELIANLLHEKSKRRNKPFMKINCAAIPENLLESEFFGYEEGAFTGALKGGKTGIFEGADSGTILLDEISEMPLHLQAKILRVLQEQQVRRIGSNRDKPIDVRVISATNAPLLEKVEKKQFREDLYYRLNIIELRVPGLRDRQEDIPLLIQYFIKQFNTKYDKKIVFESEVIRLLCELEYKGNVRELRNIIESLVVQSKNDLLMQEEALELLNISKSELINQFRKLQTPEGEGLKEMLIQYEKHILKEYFEKYENVTAVAKQLKVDRTTISKKKSMYNL